MNKRDWVSPDTGQQSTSQPCSSNSIGSPPGAAPYGSMIHTWNDFFEKTILESQYESLGDAQNSSKESIQEDSRREKTVDFKLQLMKFMKRNKIETLSEPNRILEFGRHSYIATKMKVPGRSDGGLDPEMVIVADSLILQYNIDDTVMVSDIVDIYNPVREARRATMQLSDQKDLYATCLEMKDYEPYFSYGLSDGSVHIGNVGRKTSNEFFFGYHNPEESLLFSETVANNEKCRITHVRRGEFEPNLLAFCSSRNLKPEGNATILDVESNMKETVQYSASRPIRDLAWSFYSPHQMVFACNEALRLVDIRTEKFAKNLYLSKPLKRLTCDPHKTAEILTFDGVDFNIYDSRMLTRPYMSLDIGRYLFPERMVSFQYDRRYDSILHVRTDRKRFLIFDVSHTHVSQLKDYKVEVKAEDQRYWRHKFRRPLNAKPVEDDDETEDVLVRGDLNIQWPANYVNHLEGTTDVKPGTVHCWIKNKFDETHLSEQIVLCNQREALRKSLMTASVERRQPVETPVKLVEEMMNVTMATTCLTTYPGILMVNKKARVRYYELAFLQPSKPVIKAQQDQDDQDALRKLSLGEILHFGESMIHLRESIKEGTIPLNDVAAAVFKKNKGQLWSTWLKNAAEIQYGGKEYYNVNSSMIGRIIKPRRHHKKMAEKLKNEDTEISKFCAPLVPMFYAPTSDYDPEEAVQLNIKDKEIRKEMIMQKELKESGHVDEDPKPTKPAKPEENPEDEEIQTQWGGEAETPKSTPAVSPKKEPFRPPPMPRPKFFGSLSKPKTPPVKEEAELIPQIVPSMPPRIKIFKPMLLNQRELMGAMKDILSKKGVYIDRLQEDGELITDHAEMDRQTIRATLDQSLRLGTNNFMNSRMFSPNLAQFLMAVTADGARLFDPKNQMRKAPEMMKIVFRKLTKKQPAKVNGKPLRVRDRSALLNFVGRAKPRHRKLTEVIFTMGGEKNSKLPMKDKRKSSIQNMPRLKAKHRGRRERQQVKVGERTYYRTTSVKSSADSSRRRSPSSGRQQKSQYEIELDQTLSSDLPRPLSMSTGSLISSRGEQMYGGYPDLRCHPNQLFFFSTCDPSTQVKADNGAELCYQEENPPPPKIEKLLARALPVPKVMPDRKETRMYYQRHKHEENDVSRGAKCGKCKTPVQEVCPSCSKIPDKMPKCYKIRQEPRLVCTTCCHKLVILECEMYAQTLAMVKIGLNFNLGETLDPENLFVSNSIVELEKAMGPILRQRQLSDVSPHYPKAEEDFSDEETSDDVADEQEEEMIPTQEDKNLIKQILVKSVREVEYLHVDYQTKIEEREQRLDKEDFDEAMKRDIKVVAPPPEKEQQPEEPSETPTAQTTTEELELVEVVRPDGSTVMEWVPVGTKIEKKKKKKKKKAVKKVEDVLNTSIETGVDIASTEEFNQTEQDTCVLSPPPPSPPPQMVKKPKMEKWKQKTAKDYDDYDPRMEEDDMFKIDAEAVPISELEVLSFLHEKKPPGPCECRYDPDKFNYSVEWATAEEAEAMTLRRQTIVMEKVTFADEQPEKMDQTMDETMSAPFYRLADNIELNGSQKIRSVESTKPFSDTIEEVATVLDLEPLPPHSTEVLVVDMVDEDDLDDESLELEKMRRVAHTSFNTLMYGNHYTRSELYKTFLFFAEKTIGRELKEIELNVVNDLLAHLVKDVFKNAPKIDAEIEYPTIRPLTQDAWIFNRAVNILSLIEPRLRVKPNLLPSQISPIATLYKAIRAPSAIRRKIHVQTVNTNLPQEWTCHPEKVRDSDYEYPIEYHKRHLESQKEHDRLMKTQNRLLDSEEWAKETSLESGFRMTGLPGLLFLAKEASKESDFGKQNFRGTYFYRYMKKFKIHTSPARQLMLLSAGLPVPDKLQHILCGSRSTRTMLSALFVILTHGRGDLIPKLKRVSVRRRSRRRRRRSKTSYFVGSKKFSLLVFLLKKYEKIMVEKDEEMKYRYDTFLKNLATKSIGHATPIPEFRACALFMLMVSKQREPHSIVDRILKLRLTIDLKLLYVINFCDNKTIRYAMETLYKQVNGLNKLAFIGLGKHESSIAILQDYLTTTNDSFTTIQLLGIGRCYDDANFDDKWLGNENLLDLGKSVTKNFPALQGQFSSTQSQVAVYGMRKKEKFQLNTRSFNKSILLMAEDLRKQINAIHLPMEANILVHKIPRINLPAQKLFKMDIQCYYCKTPVRQGIIKSLLGEKMSATNMRYSEKRRIEDLFMTCHDFYPVDEYMLPEFWESLSYEKAQVTHASLLAAGLLSANMCKPIANDDFYEQLVSMNGCFKCRKALPKCSVCRHGYHVMNSLFNDWEEKDEFTFCSICSHGGHITHMLEWFSNEETCAIADCSCNCYLLTNDLRDALRTRAYKPSEVNMEEKREKLRNDNLTPVQRFMILMDFDTFKCMSRATSFKNYALK